MRNLFDIMNSCIDIYVNHYFPRSELFIEAFPRYDEYSYMTRYKRENFGLIMCYEEVL